MIGLSAKILEIIERIVAGQFDQFNVQLLGIIPKLSKDKKIVFTSTRNNLSSLYLQALGSRQPDKTEEEVLKTLLRVSSGYVDALKIRTQTRVIQAANAYAQEQQLKKESVRPSVIKNLINKEMSKATSHLKLIANSETNKAVNTGTAMQIMKVADDNGDTDPTVFFNVVKDDVTGPEEFVLHLLKDRQTPRLWKLSEIGTEYHKVGDPNPKLPGLHPNCRCKLTYLPKGFGFNESGKLTWISLDHDELEAQREKYGKPR